VVVTAIALAAPSLARAQDVSQAAANQGGPMKVELVTEHYAIAPEVKITDVDGTTGALIGGHGGVLVGKRLLVGAGLYTLANGSGGRGMTYGGGVVTWQWFDSHTFSGSVRGLVGLGSGTATQTLALTDRQGRSFTQTRLFSSDFFVAEPQADLLIRLTRHLRLAVGAGYRLTNADLRLNDRRVFDGASGSLALRIGPAN